MPKAELKFAFSTETIISTNLPKSALSVYQKQKSAIALLMSWRFVYYLQSMFRRD